MKLEKTKLPGAYLVHIEPRHDERGFFARTWCAREFAEAGLDAKVVQCNVSYNACRGTLRGMHYQAEPHAEPKLVRCTRGSIYDVLVDLRPGSSTYCQWFAATLTAESRQAVFVPRGLAHGFQTLEDGTEVLYQMGEFNAPSHARGVRWDDPAFRIAWPVAEKIVSERDRSFTDFHP